MKIVAIIQARMGSTRLPGKMLLPLLDTPLIQHVIERTQRATKIDALIVAYPGTKENDDTIGRATRRCASRGEVWPFWYEGDENDLVGRYLSAAEGFKADLIVRIPGDNPCVDPYYIDLAVEHYLALPRIYESTMYPCVHDHCYLDGVGAEVVSMSRLQWLDQHTIGCAPYREHPHLYFQDQHLIDGWEQYQRHANHSETIRLDVNTQADYDCIRSIYDHFGHNQFTAEEIVASLDARKVAD
jgi:spore coat polysaccharide biosynthesis protein SpsF (cytidylyltransferase family)